MAGGDASRSRRGRWILRRGKRRACGGNIARFAQENPRCPVMLHFGMLDKHIPKEKIDKVKALHPEVQIFWYENADHGFNCDQRDSHNPAAAKLARERSLAFLKEHLTNS